MKALNIIKFFTAALYYKYFKSKKKQLYCPCCSSLLDSHIDLENAGAPKAGDYTICLYCTNILYFEKNKVLKKATDYQINDLSINYPDAHKFLIETQKELKTGYFE